MIKLLSILVILVGCQQISSANPTGEITSSLPQGQRFFQPEVEIQKKDYARVRRHFRTKLLRQGPAPQEWQPYQIPPRVSEVEFTSGKLLLKAWIYQPPEAEPKRPAVLFLHGGFAFGPPDWDMAQPYRDAGYVVMVPILRAENGQAGLFTMFYDEVNDVLAAAEFLRKQRSVDANHMYVAGHSAGGTLALLAALTSTRFRAAAAFDGSPDQQLLFNGSAQRPWVPKEVVFDHMDLHELQVRSPLAYARSFKCPVRIYYSTEAAYLFQYPSIRTAALAKERGLDVEAIKIEGTHVSHVASAMKYSIEFFRKTEQRGGGH
jgi:dipeptidyl aminopeptidase/acylaminoacyl peptidase